MTDSTIVDSKQVGSDKDDFDSIFSDIQDKTDDEVAEYAATKADAEPTDGDGDPNKDQDKTAEADEATPAEETIKPTEGDGQEKPATDNDSIDLQMKIDSLEADLKKERQRTQSWDGRIKAANDKVKTLEAENASLKTALETVKETMTTDDDGKAKESYADLKAKFTETFPELVDILDMYETNMDKKFTPPAKAEPETKPEVKPEVKEETKADTSTEADSTDLDKHMGDIRKVHPELDEVVASGILLTWINKQDASIMPHLSNIYNGQNGQGSAQQVIDLITNFKLKSGWKSQLDTTGKAQDDKLKSMMAAEGDSAGPKSEGPNMSDFESAAKEAFK